MYFILKTTKKKKKVEIFIEEEKRYKSSFVAKVEIMKNKFGGSPLHGDGAHTWLVYVSFDLTRAMYSVLREVTGRFQE